MAHRWAGTVLLTTMDARKKFLWILVFLLDRRTMTRDLLTMVCEAGPDGWDIVKRRMGPAEFIASRIGQKEWERTMPANNLSYRV